ncbi:DUF2270 domain-containing protein [Halorientalis salina]|uniref:DUF2270 domain-containing protein n=1 Tax=Halorientalis salina TaxID=2932266 RepID=UPI0010AC1A62|nr:DUF2270 domain-containing protein [Halorientalis salina]
MGDDTDDSGLTDIGERISGDVDSATSLLGHYYRGELDRMNTEQTRMDKTTNWAITIMAAILAYVFSSGTRPHYILLVGILTLEMLHVAETRRYRSYDTWRSRVRLVEEDLFAPLLDPEPGVTHENWRQELGNDLRNPALKMPFVEAYSRRLRRIYLPLYLILLAAWTAQILVISPGGGPLDAAAILDIPGWIVIGAVTTFTAVVLAVAFWPRKRQAKGELNEKQKEGDWKGDEVDQ